ncbi:hypothetical protein F5144DRAFT_482231 [Chaetomium tenue]|uniref:Uncharacterized protein n=1 Tax=Chaetomium tenue TaxID=1854479 RepID=A0ACB7PLL9_9PEZI|nr:hypothetical protein F5144DRAFT_482231 [Chaetomium globosum]
MKDGPTPMLFNDVHFSHCEAVSPVPCFPAWPLFSRLPVELRLHIWTLHLQRHRMIELDIFPADDDPHCYTDRNDLGRLVSGRRYTFSVRGRGRSFAPPFSLLLQVNREARMVALNFYHIHLPFPGRQYKEQILYINADYDVVYVRPRQRRSRDHPQGCADLLVDFLHDARAYDNKGQGVAHLALGEAYPYQLFERATGLSQPRVHLTPETLHPVATASFSDILRSQLRSLFFVIGFRFDTRGMGSTPATNWRFHFAQTFPLHRRGNPVGRFHWFGADPRPGLELDLLQVPFNSDPRGLLEGWRRLESAFGITQEHRIAQEKQPNGFRLYICPTHRWPSYSVLMASGITTFGGPEDGEEQEVWSRDELAKHLEFEDEDWLRDRVQLTRIFRGPTILPKYAYNYPEARKTLELMEKLPCTAVGMWLFPADAFKEFTCPEFFSFNVAGVRPGLFLFEV